jgi:hypothetical protein
MRFIHVFEFSGPTIARFIIRKGGVNNLVQISVPWVLTYRIGAAIFSCDYQDSYHKYKFLPYKNV